jgi:hypothetical protein
MSIENRPEEQQQQEEARTEEVQAFLPINSKMSKEVLLLPSASGVTLGLLDKEGNLVGKSAVGSRDPNPKLKFVGGGEIKLDLKAAGKSGVQSLTLETDKDTTVKIDDWTGKPPIGIAPGSKAVIDDADKLLEFKPTTPPGTMKSSAITFEKDEKTGIVTVVKDGQPIMVVPKDTKVDILGEDGKPLMTIDSSKKAEDLQKDLAKAEKKAFEQFQKESKDPNVKSAKFRSGNEPDPAPPQPKVPGMMDKLAADARQVIQNETQNLGNTVKNQVLNQVGMGDGGLLTGGSVPRLPGGGTGRA